VSADDAATVEALRARLALAFPLVSDPKLEVAERYGVRQKGLDLALPATFVVGADGTIRFVHVAPNPVDRMKTSDLLHVLDDLARPR
jgi:peroxiredoxin